MARIYLAHYDASDKIRFRSDLLEKSEALLVFHANRLIGFSLYRLYRDHWRGRPIRVLYSGDTVVEQAHWGQQALAFNWIARAGQIERTEPDVPLYWFLIVKGHRTYRYLHSFSRSFHPHWSEPRDDLQPLLEHLAARRFGAAYDPARGVISFPESRGHLKAEYAYPTARESAKEPVRFFLETNPGYLHGDELACLCELRSENLKPLSRRIFVGDC
jgi:hypothetical protein